MRENTALCRPTILPSWLPSEIQAALDGQPYSFELPRPVKLRLRQPHKILVSEWAAKYRMVADGAHAGPWRHDFAPHTVQIMDTFGLPWVREVWFCGVEQSGKTNTMLNCLGWAVDCDPGNIFYLMPTEETSRKVTGGKLQPLLSQSPRLQRYLSSRKDDIGLNLMRLLHGISIFPAHANSASSMASWAAKHCFGDEVDKYPPQAGQEASPIELIRKRNRTYKGRYKRFFASTPAGAFIYRGVYGSETEPGCAQVWQMHLRCPHCQELIRADSDHLLTDGEPRYACNSCGVEWDESDRERAIRGGQWVCVKGADLTRPTTVGFHHRAWECLDITLVEIAHAYRLAKTGSRADKVAWANGYEAIDYVEETASRSEEHILRLVDLAIPRGIAPRNPCLLMLHVDTQRHGFFYQVWAYGWGRDLESWRIDHGFVEHFSHLVDIAAKPWTDADGVEYKIGAAFIDSGGGTNPHQPKHSRTAEVYEFCRKNPLFKPLKGRRDMAQPWNATRIDYYPSRDGKKIPIPGGITLYTVNVTYFKNELATKLQIEPGDPGAFHLHADMGDDYAKQMCAEYQDERGYWLCPRGRANHHWDISVYGLAAAAIMQVRNRQPPKPSHDEVKPARPRGNFATNWKR